MFGYPKYINSKQDVDFILREFPNDPRNVCFLQSLLDDRFAWFPCGNCTEDIKHKKVIENKMSEDIVSFYELKENPSAKIFQLGYSVIDIENKLVKEGEK